MLTSKRSLTLKALLVFIFSPLNFALLAQGILTNGGVNNGTLGPGASQIWSFTVSAGQFYRVEISEPDATNRPLYLSNTNSSGATACNTGGFGWFNCAASTGDVLSVTVKRTDTAPASLPYTITLALSPDAAFNVPDEGGPMTNGVPVTGSVTTGDIDMWTFRAAVGDVISANHSPGGGGGVLFYTVSPNGMVNFDSSDFAVTVAGTYTVYVAATDNSRTSAIGYAMTINGASGSPTPLAGKDLGAVCLPCLAQAGSTGVEYRGDPVNVATGNLFEEVQDYSTVGANPLAFIRYFNSQAKAQSTPFATMLGVNWHSNFDRYLKIASPSSVLAERPHGRILTFTLNGSAWTSDTDIDASLMQSGANWILKDSDDTTETYTTISTTQAQLNTITARNGYTQTMHYGGSKLTSVIDSYNRTLTFTYTGNLLTGLTTPDTLVLTYGYGRSGSSSLLTSVGYNTSPVTSQAYIYGDSANPLSLTGITDEKGNRFTTWAYDAKNRVTSSQHAGGADLTTFSYDDSTGYTTVTNALGEAETYKFRVLQNMKKISEIDRAANGSVAAAQRLFTYDARGYVSTGTDWDGRSHRYVNNIHGQPTTIAEGYVGTASPIRSWTETYDTTWVHLPHTIVRGGLTTTFIYDAASGNLLSKTIADASTYAGTYSSASRVWTYSWNNFLLATVQNPRTDLTAAQRTTTYGYDASGALTSITNGLGQKTRITAHTGGGRPTTIVDPNGVTTTLIYSPRQWLSTSSVATAAGARATTLTYDAAGNLRSTALPGGATLTNSYDNAHRLTTVTDLFSQTMNYTLDALGDVTAMTLKNSSGTTKRSHGATFDVVGRMITDVGGASQTTTYGYDGQGNATSIIDAKTNPTVVQTFDALDRLTQVKDHAAGLTRYTYDPYYDWITKVIAPNGATTTYTYDGYGNLILLSSPDSGNTFFYYDQAGNLTQKKDALSIITNHTYDALNRRLSNSYPAASTENVVYTYDQAGHGFGIGRLTSMTDQAGTLSRSYDERGNLTTEMRTRGAVALTTGYSYDAAGNLAALTYPDGMIVTSVRDSMEKIAGLTLKPSATGAAQIILGSITYQPFGPAAGFSYGNGITHSRTFDADYRMTNLTDAATATIQNLTYGFDANNNVHTITDAVTSGNSQTLGYDPLDRLTSATGAYGSQTYGYDASGNRIMAGATTNTYTVNSNRLTSVGIQAVTTNANGNITNIAYPTAAGFTYNKANRLATATLGGGTVLTYLYDGFGQRITKTDTAQRFMQYGQEGALLEVTDNLGHAAVDYIYLDGRPVATFVQGGTMGTLSFIHTDRLGQPLVATSASKAIGWNINPDPFGAPNVGTTTSISNDLRFLGQEYESSVGFNHNGWRDYAPALGRYLETDPMGLAAGANTYTYANGNPGSFIDKLGLETTLSLGTLIGQSIKDFADKYIFTFDYSQSALDTANAATLDQENSAAKLRDQALEKGSLDCAAVQALPDFLPPSISIPDQIMSIISTAIQKLHDTFNPPLTEKTWPEPTQK